MQRAKGRKTVGYRSNKKKAPTSYSIHLIFIFKLYIDAQKPQKDGKNCITNVNENAKGCKRSVMRKKREEHPWIHNPEIFLTLFVNKSSLSLRID